MPSDTASGIWRLTQVIGRSAPLIHNITNVVMQHDTAAVISAVGATQATLHIPEEAREAAEHAAALAINTGTPDADWTRCARTAVQVAAERAIPWTLDPVAVGFTAYRTEIVRDFLQHRPTVIKANASEILALAGKGPGGRGADSIHSVDQAQDAADHLARRYRCTVIVTGPEDLVTDGTQHVRIANGHPLLGQMIGSGCMLNAVIGCYLAVTPDAFDAAVAAVARFAIAGETAAERASGPGTLKPLLLDALYAFDENTLHQRLNIKTSTPRHSNQTEAAGEASQGNGM